MDHLSINVKNSYLPSNITRRNSPHTSTIRNRTPTKQQNNYKENNFDLKDIQINNLINTNNIFQKNNKKDSVTINILFFIIIVLSIVITFLIIYLVLFNNEDSTIKYEKYLFNKTSVDYAYFKEELKKVYNYSKSIQIILNDKNYLLPNINFIKEFVKKDITNKNTYILEKNDCDNFSFILYGNLLELQNKYNISNSFLFGVAYVIRKESTHIINIFMDDYKKIYCLEPQNDNIYICKNNEMIYRVII